MVSTTFIWYLMTWQNPTSPENLNGPEHRREEEQRQSRTRDRSHTTFRWVLIDVRSCFVFLHLLSGSIVDVVLLCLFFITFLWWWHMSWIAFKGPFWPSRAGLKSRLAVSTLACRCWHLVTWAQNCTQIEASRVGSTLNITMCVSEYSFVWRMMHLF